MEEAKDVKSFSVRDRIKSTNHAWRGVCLLFENTHNLWVHFFFAVLALYLGFLLNITTVEWGLIVLSIGIVITAEAFNTAIEIDINLTSPEYHPYAKDTKDVAAGAVLLAVFVAIIIGMIIFLPKIFPIFL